MNFFYINNSQCTSCDRCAEVCATGAIYLHDEKRYINYDRCTSCGSCMKACSVDAITLESLEGLTREMEQTHEYKDRIGRLEHELTQLKEQVRVSDQNLSAVVAMLPIAVFVADPKLRIVVAGQTLTRLLGLKGTLPEDTPEGLVGVSLESLLPGQLMRGVSAAAATKEVFSAVTEAAGRPISFSVVPLAGDMMMGVVRTLGEHSEVRDEVASKLREAIERQLSTVQKIGFLLGEEISAVVGNINSVIDIVEKGAKK